jgi:hypothetical protein
LKGDDSGQLRMVLRMWQATFPDGYTIRGCKNVLAAEVSCQWGISLRSLIYVGYGRISINVPLYVGGHLSTNRLTN